MDIYVTGDTHSNFEKIYDFVQYLENPSIIIVSGDFGGIWAVDNPKQFGYREVFLKAENKELDKLSQVLNNHKLYFVDGNHENFERLYNMDVVVEAGAKAHKIRSNIYHILRGEILNIDDIKIFCFGGAYSHDISGGIVKTVGRDKRGIKKSISIKERDWLPYRIDRVSWWEEEKPSSKELEYGYEQINKVKQVDYVITHQTNVQNEILLGIKYKGEFGMEFHNFLEYLDNKLDFKAWFFGHYHGDIQLSDRHRLIYNSFVLLEKDKWKTVY